MTKEDLRTRIEAELLTGSTPRQLEEKYKEHNIPYVTINSWNKKLMAEKPTEAIGELTHLTTATLEVIRQKAKEEAPKVVKKIDAIVDGVEGLQALAPEFQTAMHKAVMMAQAFLDEVDDEGTSVVTIKEWQLITSTLAQTYAALFNSKGTTVNVNQNNLSVQSENLKFFKGNQKAI